MEPCRKCSTPNPESNQYCKSCGAVLAVATSLVKAQPRTLFPMTRGFRWRWVALGVPVILGTATITLIGLAVAGTVIVGAGISSGSLASIGAKAPGMAIVSALIFLISFALGGLVVARMSEGRTVAEPAVASLLVLLLLASASLAVSTDALLVAALFALPCAAMGALGGWFGEIGEKGGSEN